MNGNSTETTVVSRRSLLKAAILTAEGAVIVVGGGFAGRGSATSLLSSQASTAASPGASPVASPGASPVATPGSAIVVGMIDINFDVKEFSIPANRDVPVGLVNRGVLQHDFVIDELGVKSKLFNGGESGSVTINGAPGQYQYYCSVPGHKEAGMVGVLTVT